MNLRELNYILIPKSSGSWERWESSRTGRIVQPLLEVLGSITTEGQVVFVAMLITGAAGIDVRYSHLYLVFSGLFGLLVAALLLRPIGYIRARDLAVTLEHPAFVMAGEAAHFTVVMRNQGRRGLFALRASGPFLPWDGTYVGRRPALSVLPAGSEARLTLTARFLVRGERSLGPFAVGSVRPLGLARGNRRPTSPARFIVLPRPVPVLEMPLPTWRYAAAGTGQLASGGESFELMGVRPYRPGDRPRDLHARAWARHGEPIVREMRQEAEQRAGIVVDLTLTAQREVVDAALGLAGGMAAYLVSRNVLVDVCVIGRQAMSVSAGNRAAPVSRIWEMLALVEAGPPGPDASSDPTQFSPTRWSAAHLVVAHGPTDVGDSPYLRARALKQDAGELHTYAVRERAGRAKPPPADHVFDVETLARSAGLRV